MTPDRDRPVQVDVARPGAVGRKPDTQHFRRVSEMVRVTWPEARSQNFTVLSEPGGGGVGAIVPERDIVDHSGRVAKCRASCSCPVSQTLTV